MRGFDRCLAELERFLPFIDNWATCDCLRPKVFAKNKARLLERIPAWLSSDPNTSTGLPMCAAGNTMST